MRVDGDAAAVIGDDEVSGLFQLHLDEARVARHRLVHGVVDHLGEEVVQGALVGAADIHAGPAPDRLQPLQDLDRRGIVAGLRGLRGRRLDGEGFPVPRGRLGCRAAGEQIHGTDTGSGRSEPRGASRCPRGTSEWPRGAWSDSSWRGYTGTKRKRKAASAGCVSSVRTIATALCTQSLNAVSSAEPFAPSRRRKRVENSRSAPDPPAAALRDRDHRGARRHAGVEVRPARRGRLVGGGRRRSGLPRRPRRDAARPRRRWCRRG